MGERVVSGESLDNAIAQTKVFYGGDCRVNPTVITALVKHPKADEYYQGFAKLAKSKTGPEIQACLEAIETEKSTIIRDVEEATGQTVSGQDSRAASMLFWSTPRWSIVFSIIVKRLSLTKPKIASKP